MKRRSGNRGRSQAIGQETRPNPIDVAIDALIGTEERLEHGPGQFLGLFAGFDLDQVGDLVVTELIVYEQQGPGDGEEIDQRKIIAQDDLLVKSVDFSVDIGRGQPAGNWPERRLGQKPGVAIGELDKATAGPRLSPLVFDQVTHRP